MVDNLLEIIKERKSQEFYKTIDVHTVANAISEIEVNLIFLMIAFFVGM